MLIDKIKIGEEYPTNNCGNIKVLSIIDNQNVSVIFIRSELVKIVSVEKLLKGQIQDGNPLKIGAIYNSNNFGPFKILNPTYEGKTQKYDIQFLETGYIKKDIQKSKIFQGKVQDDTRTLGQVGVGKYKNLEKEHKELHAIWRNTLNRGSQNKYFKYYKDVEICDEWRNFQNFADWYYKELKKYNYNIKEVSLDKDVLYNVKHLDKRIYSPETCLLIPKDINFWLSGYSLKVGVSCKKYKYGYTYLASTFIDGRNIKLYKGNSFKEAKIIYANKRKEFWIKYLENFDKNKLPNEIKEILLQYDFSWKWVWESMSEEEIFNKWYK